MNKGDRDDLQKGGVPWNKGLNKSFEPKLGGTVIRKVQIKSRYPKNGTINIELYTSMSNYIRVYSDGDFQLIAVHNASNDKIALLDWEDVKPVSNVKHPSFTLVTDYSLCKRKSQTKAFDQYII